jgi:short-subunit dehydrogenase
MPFEETRALMEINFMSVVYLTKLVLPDMISRNSGKVG